MERSTFVSLIPSVQIEQILESPQSNIANYILWIIEEYDPRVHLNQSKERVSLIRNALDNFYFWSLFLRDSELIIPCGSFVPLVRIYFQLGMSN
jgi:hypothetical protein